MLISQHCYIEKILAQFIIANFKPVPTPQVQVNCPMPGHPDVEPVYVNLDPDVDYRKIVRWLQLIV